MSLKDDIDKIEREVEILVEELDKEVKDFVDTTIVTPNWNDVQKKKNLYKGYRKVVRKNNELNKLLVKLGDSIIALKDLKTSLSKSKSNKNLPMKLLKRVRNNLDSYISKLYQYKNVLENEKDSYDNTLRFYNSAQYILGSPRMSGYD